MKPAIMKLIVLLAAALAASCARGPIKIGISFAAPIGTQEEKTAAALAEELGKLGYTAVAMNAGQDGELQNKQIGELVQQGAKLILIFPYAVDLCATAVDAASSRGVKIISCGRLILSPKVNAYIGFDPAEIGREQARGLLEKAPRGRFVLMGGSPTSIWAHRLRAGQVEVLLPLEQNGTISIVADQWADNGSADSARSIMARIITELGAEGFDAVAASDDETALGVLGALRWAGLAGIIPVSGNGATLEACRWIWYGELSFSILADQRLLPKAAAELADELIRGKKNTAFTLRRLSDYSEESGDSAMIQCVFLPITRVTAENMESAIISSGVYAKEEVFMAPDPGPAWEPEPEIVVEPETMPMFDFMPEDEYGREGEPPVPEEADIILD